MNILYIIIFVFIIISIYYTLVIKKNNLDTFINQNNYENFTNKIDEYNVENVDEYDDFLIKYSSINMSLDTIDDVITVQKMVEKFKRDFYVSVNDSYILNNNDIINIINNNIKDTLIKINQEKIKSPIYVMILEGKEKEDATKFVKIIIFYPNIPTNNGIEIFDKYFLKGDFNGKTLIYKVNNKNKINHHLE